MPKKMEMLCRAALALAVMVSCATSAQASLLIYDGFNGYATGALAGQAVNGNTIGLTGSYTVSSGIAGIDYTSTGLTFGSGATTYVVSGGAAQNIGNTYGGVGVGLNTGAITGTLYGSYLVNFGASYGGGARIETRFNTNQTNATGTSFFNASANTNASKLGLKYGVADSVAASADVSASLGTSLTMMVVEKWTGIGTASGTGTMWVLSSAQYDASGGTLTETYLNSNSLASFTTSSTNLTTLDNSNFMQFIVGNGTAGYTRTIDEIKFGTTLLDVTAVPEPNVMALLCGAVFVLFVSVRKRRLNSSGLVGVTR